MTGLAPDAATFAPDGSTTNITGDTWLKANVNYYINQNYIDFTPFAAPAKVLTGPLATATTGMDVIEYKFSPKDQAYTVKDFNSLGALVGTASFTVPHGAFGHTTIPVAPESYLEIDGTGIPEVVVNGRQQVVGRAIKSGVL